MKKQLTRIAPLKAGIILGILYGLMGLIIIAPFVLLMSLISSKTGNAMPFGGGLIMAILAPVFYAVVGFIGGVIMAAIYNLIAGWTGGFEFEVQDLI